MPECTPNPDRYSPWQAATLATKVRDWAVRREAAARLAALEATAKAEELQQIWNVAAECLGRVGVRPFIANPEIRELHQANLAGRSDIAPTDDEWLIGYAAIEACLGLDPNFNT